MLQPISDIGRTIGLGPDDLAPYGHHIAKIAAPAVERARSGTRGRLILVTAITPTPAGEGKTTTSIGLAQGLKKIGENVAVALREPSLGPCMGMKGGATGGGASSVHPGADINLHFTGDLHAITSAHNLLSAMLDNHLHHGNALRIDPRRVLWKRVMDHSDRALRNINVGLGGTSHGVPREDGFDITAASEVMAMLCLAEDPDDLRARLSRTLVGFDQSKEPVTAGQLNAVEGMTVLLKDAIKPNLVQTTEGVPALIHGGPFANIAHGCNSVIATKTALGLADWVITEAGFGMDLGGEKFFGIKARGAELDVAAVVLVATVRALKMHGGVDKKELETPNPDAVARGLENLEKHIESIRAFGREPVIAINRFAADTDEEMEVVASRCRELGVEHAFADHFAKGGDGARELAEKVKAKATQSSGDLRFLYGRDDEFPAKVEAVAKTIYGASAVSFSAPALRQMRRAKKLGFGHFPICMAKTQSSLSDDPKRLGRPRDFELTVRNVEISAGAGFLVVLTGDMMRMPGLPKVPRAEKIRLVGEEVTGLMG